MVKRVFVFLLIMSVISLADFVREKKMNALDVLNHYPRKRLLMGLSGGMCFIRYGTGSHFSSGKVNDEGNELETFLIGKGVDEVYEEGDGRSLEMGVWFDYWWTRRWGVIFETGIQEIQASNEGEVTLRKTNPDWNVPICVSEDELKYELKNIYFRFCPKVTFLNIYVYGGVGLNINIDSKIDFKSKLVSGDAYGVPVEYYSEKTGEKGRERRIQQSLDDVKSVYSSWIVGLGGYFPVTKNFWFLPEFRIERNIDSPFSSPMKYHVKLKEEKEDMYEEKRILRMEEPGVDWFNAALRLNLVYRF